VGHAAHYRGEEKVHTGFWWGNPKERGMDGRITLRWIFRKWNRGA